MQIRTRTAHAQLVHFTESIIILARPLGFLLPGAWSRRIA